MPKRTHSCPDAPEPRALELGDLLAVRGGGTPGGVTDPSAWTKPGEPLTALERIRLHVETLRVLAADETTIHDALTDLLSELRVTFEHEVRLDAHDRIDFLVEGGVGIEVKVDGSAAALIRQLHRYAGHDRIRALVVVTNRARLHELPSSLRGKPVVVASLLAGSL